ncbi:hypothetical protein [Salinibaculum salinum]|uniref:hypothetical protein n=1 Tax=Salinibaculum salinum TaxID=3131996 RepID=UPI0030EE86EB
MHALRSDTDSNTMYMMFSGEVTVADLSRLERTAVVAARVLDREFVLVTDVTDCVSVTDSALERIDDVVGQLKQFGLAREIRVVEETTSDRVRQRFGRMDADRGVAVDVVDAADESSSSVPERANR